MTAAALSCLYAAMILNDDDVEITEEKIDAILNASEIKVEHIWIELFVNCFNKHDISEMIKHILPGKVSCTSKSIKGTDTPTLIEENQTEMKEEEEENEIEGFDDLFNHFF